ncbi:hypothetical protein P154DRAFT_108536 [Amniculicola lignicola CBS 123094]|uniref:Uncharacterized protein n=1 Tax=Amniculicola lignicola CBS 123094 TaxID=1392246 RepID=A0A6A5WPM5_9PLEO|nr:hypothetical protein P154DRAFT_108536 [Amniculicola lignicola CBS 123094]
MKSRDQKKYPAKKPRRLFCGLGRRSPSPDTRPSNAPPQNAIPVSTLPVTQQPSDHGNGRPPASVAVLPPRQTATLHSPVGGRLSQGAQPQGPQTRGDPSQVPSLEATPLQTPASQTRPSQVLPLQPPILLGWPSDIPPLQATRPILLPPPKQTRPVTAEPPRPKTPKPSPLFFPKFMNLPREIRDLIWLQKLRDLNPPASLPICQIPKALPAFCFISRQVFYETMPLFLQLCSIELGNRDHARKLFQFLNHVPNGEAYRGVRSLAFQNCWAWTSASGLPILREVLSSCNCVQHIMLVVTQKFLYEPVYYNPPGAKSPPPNRSEHRKRYIRMHLLADLDRLFLHDSTRLRTIRLRGSIKYDALQLSTLPTKMPAKRWLGYLETSGTIPAPTDALLDMKFADWREFIKSTGGECSQWMEQLMRQAPKKTCDAKRFTGSFSYSPSASTSPAPASSVDESSAYIPLFFASTPRRAGTTIYESSDYYAPSGFESGSYEWSGYEGPRSPDRPSGFWSSGAKSPGYRSSISNSRPGFIGPGL